MAEQDDLKNLLWMFRDRAPAAEPGPVRLDAVQETYHPEKNSRNPYLKRAIAPAAVGREETGEKGKAEVRMLSGQEGYQVTPSNRDTPFFRRNLEHPAPPPVAGARYLEPERMPGDPYKLPWLIHDFFQAILARLQTHPGEFDALVEELTDLFDENKVKIRLYEAYHTFDDWDDLMETLGEVSHYPSPETFDLFCSALFTYYELVHPPGE